MARRCLAHQKMNCSRCSTESTQQPTAQSWTVTAHRWDANTRMWRCLGCGATYADPCSCVCCLNRPD